MANTTNLVMPLMSAAQSQKHVTHNDALIRLDAVVQLSIKDRDLTAPPGAPVEGDRYMPASGATGAWAGKDLNIVYYQDGAWQYVVPREGWLCWVEDENVLLIWNGTVWADFATQYTLIKTANLSDGTILQLGVNTSSSTTNRLAVKSNAVLLSHDDVTPGTGNMAVTLNKSAAAKDASMTFQDAFSTRALYGLLGDDDFTIKVSPDGSTFFTGIVIDKDTGNVAIGSGSDATNKLLVSGTNMLFTSSGSLSFTFNKNATADDCSLTFQKGFSARALVGLLGDDNFTFKVTPDGSTYKTGFTIDKSTGAVDHTQGAKFSAYLNFGQDYTAGAWRDLLFNNTRHNDQSAAAIASNVLTFTAPTAGYYLFGAGATYEAGSAPTKMQVGLDVNSSGTPNSDTIGTTGDATVVSGETRVMTTALLKLAAGDTVKAKIFFTTNNGRVLANENYFWGCRVA